LLQDGNAFAREMLDERTKKAEAWHHNAATVWHIPNQLIQSLAQHLLNMSLKVEQAFHKLTRTNTSP